MFVLSAFNIDSDGDCWIQMAPRNSKANYHECHINQAGIVAAIIEIVADFIAENTKKFYKAHDQHEFFSVVNFHFNNLKSVIN
jgi:hypothetical protein